MDLLECLNAYRGLGYHTSGQDNPVTCNRGPVEPKVAANQLTVGTHREPTWFVYRAGGDRRTYEPGHRGDDRATDNSTIGVYQVQGSVVGFAG
jgi:hypothetical protein